MTRLRQVARYADDLDRTADIYTGILAGTMIAKFDPPGLAFVGLDGVRLLLERAAAVGHLRAPDVPRIDQPVPLQRSRRRGRAAPRAGRSGWRSSATARAT